MPVTRTVFSPLVVDKITSQDQDLIAFMIQIKKKGTNNLLVDYQAGALKNGIGWVIDPYTFDDAIKGQIYQLRFATKNSQGKISPFSKWINKTAGDISFGTGYTWNNAVSARSTCIDLSITLNDAPSDFERIEIYARTVSGTTGHLDWEPVFELDAVSFDYPWVGERLSDRWFYIKAFDTSGNYSSIVEIGSGPYQIAIVLPGDQDITPPEDSTVTATLDS